MKFNIIIITLLFTNFFYCQNNELGNVTIEELSEKFCPIDTSASAFIIFKKGKTKYSYYLNNNQWEVETKVSYKIKIYKKQGYQFANFSIPFISENNIEYLDFSDAYTYNLENGKIEKTKLTSSGIIIEKVNRSFNIKKIIMPSVKEGSIIEFTYTIKTPNILSLRDFQFQSTIPTKYVEYIATIPERFVFNTIITGYEKIDMNTVKDYSNSNFLQNKHTYSGINILGLIEESYVNNMNNYFSTIKFNIASVKYENYPDENLALDWQIVSKRIYNSKYFGEEMELYTYFKDDVDILIKDKTDRNEKIKIIFDYIKSKVQWNNNEGVFCENGFKKSLKEGKGNVADINLMLVSMLRYAQIESNPILLSTRDNGAVVAPSLSAFNYVIAGVEIENDVILLDATNQYSEMNILPERVLNWNGRIVRKNNTSAEINLIPKIVSSEIINLMVTISNEGNIDGKIKWQRDNFNALNFRENKVNLDKESLIQEIEKKYKNIFIEDYNIEGLKDLDVPLTERFSFKNDDCVEIINNKMYLSPLLFLTNKTNPFKQVNRLYPVDFMFPKYERYNINLTIPEGYKVESIPASMAISMSENMINLKYIINHSDNKIQLSMNLEYNSAIVFPDYYEELKAIFDEIIKKQNEKIVLIKT